MDDVKRWIVVVPEQIIGAESEADAVGLVYSLGLVGVESVAQGLRRPDDSWTTYTIEPGAPPTRPPEPQPVAHYFGDAALAAAVSRAWSALDSAVDGCPAGYAWLHDAVREARDAVGEIGEMLRAAAPPSDPPTVTPDAALAVMVGLDRSVEGGEPSPLPVAHYFGADALRAELAKLQRATLALGAHVPREFGPLYAAAQDAQAAAFAVGELLRWSEAPTAPAPAPPWRPLPDPECPETENVLVTYRECDDTYVCVADVRRRGDGTLHWYTIGRHGDDELGDVIAWMPLPEPWRGGA